MDELDFGETLKGFDAGQKIASRYTLTRRLGRGGMGVVWLARDEELGRDTALKFLPEAVAMDKAAVADLKREVRRAIDLAHPHIVKIHDFISDSRTAAVSMEYIAGGTLSALRLDEPGQVFSVEKLAPWLAQLCGALDYAHHDAQVVHRDLKPTNLMLDARGRLKVLDFGIAASISDSVSRASNKGSTSGTPVYMSPQQMFGEDPAITDDIYALGATLFELLAGKPPFHSGNIVLQVQSKAAPLLNERRAAGGHAPVPVEWEQTIAACLAKEPKDRPQSAGEVAQRLGLAAGGSGVVFGVGRVAPHAPPVAAERRTGESPPYLETKAVAAPAATGAAKPVAPEKPAPPGFEYQERSVFRHYFLRPCFWATICAVVISVANLAYDGDEEAAVVAFFGFGVLLFPLFSLLSLAFKRRRLVRIEPDGPLRPNRWLASAAAATLVPALVMNYWVASRGMDGGASLGDVSGIFAGMVVASWLGWALLYSLPLGVLIRLRTNNPWAYVGTLAAVGGGVTYLIYFAIGALPGDTQLGDVGKTMGVLAAASLYGFGGWLAWLVLAKERPPAGKLRGLWIVAGALAVLGGCSYYLVALPSDIQMSDFRRDQERRQQEEQQKLQEEAQKAQEAERLAAESAKRLRDAEVQVLECYEMVFGREPTADARKHWVELAANSEKPWESPLLRLAMRTSDEGKQGGRVLVPREFATIQEGINAAEAGNVVMVAAGTYRENLFLKSGIKLIGEGADRVMVETGPDNWPLYAGEVTGAEVRGFTFRHTGTNEDERRSSLVGIVDASIVLSANRLLNSNGNALWIKGAGRSVVRGNVVSGARWDGIVLNAGVQCEVADNEVRENAQTGITVRERVGEAAITGNRVERNGTNGIWVAEGDGVKLTDNRVLGNSVAKENYGGIGIGAGRPSLRGNTASGNRGAGIWWNSEKAAPVFGPGNIADGQELPRNDGIVR